jgi:hypothetical protein
MHSLTLTHVTRAREILYLYEMQYNCSAYTSDIFQDVKVSSPYGIHRFLTYMQLLFLSITCFLVCKNFNATEFILSHRTLKAKVLSPIRQNKI